MPNILKQFVLRLGALVTPYVDATGDRNVFYHYQKRAKFLQHWFDSHVSTAPVISSESEQGMDVLNDVSAQDNLQYLPMSHLSGTILDGWTEIPNTDDTMMMNGMYDLQWPSNFPDASIV